MTVAVYDAFIGALNLRQVTSGSYQSGAQPIAGMQSGAADPSEYFGGPAEPRWSGESADLASLLAAISVSGGLAVSAGTVTLPFQKRAQGGTFAAGGVHFTVSGTDGLLVPTGFSANQDDEAALAQLEFHFRSTDGVTSPASVNVNQTLAAQAFVAQFALGPAYVNAVQVGKVVGVAINPGITVTPNRYDGAIYAQDLFITRRRPTIDITFQDFDGLGAAVYAVMTSAAVYFRKRSGVSFVPDTGVGNDQHIKFSFVDGITSTETIGGSGEAAGQATLRLHGEALTVSAASFIP